MWPRARYANENRCGWRAGGKLANVVAGEPSPDVPICSSWFSPRYETSPVFLRLSAPCGVLFDFPIKHIGSAPLSAACSPSRFSLDVRVMQAKLAAGVALRLFLSLVFLQVETKESGLNIKSETKEHQPNAPLNANLCCPLQFLLFCVVSFSVSSAQASPDTLASPENECWQRCSYLEQPVPERSGVRDPS